MELSIADNFLSGIVNGIEKFLSFIPAEYIPLVKLFGVTILIVVYAIFIWKFYKLMSKRELISLNLKQYNTSEHPVFSKIFGALFFLVEYLIILPILIFFWFAVLAIFLLLLSTKDISFILFISAALIASTRMTSYISEELSEELSKLFPFTVLALFLLMPNTSILGSFVERIVEIPSLFSNIFLFMVFIIVVEIIFRVVYTIVQIFRSEEEVVEVKKRVKKK